MNCGAAFAEVIVFVAIASLLERSSSRNPVRYLFDGGAPFALTNVVRILAALLRFDDVSALFLATLISGIASTVPR